MFSFLFPPCVRDPCIMKTKIVDVLVRRGGARLSPAMEYARLRGPRHVSQALISDDFFIRAELPNGRCDRQPKGNLHPHPRVGGRLAEVTSSLRRIALSTAYFHGTQSNPQRGAT